MRLTKTLLISAVLLMSATGMQAAGFNQNGNCLLYTSDAADEL